MLPSLRPFDAAFLQILKISLPQKCLARKDLVYRKLLLWDGLTACNYLSAASNQGLLTAAAVEVNKGLCCRVLCSPERAMRERRQDLCGDLTTLYTQIQIGLAILPLGHEFWLLQLAEISLLLQPAKGIFTFSQLQVWPSKHVLATPFVLQYCWLFLLLANKHESHGCDRYTFKLLHNAIHGWD